MFLSGRIDSNRHLPSDIKVWLECLAVLSFGFVDIAGPGYAFHQQDVLGKAFCD